MEGDDSGNNSDTPVPPTKKRKGAKVVGKVAKGEDFWGKVDAYFAALVGKYGRDLAGVRWRP